MIVPSVKRSLLVTLVAMLPTVYLTGSGHYSKGGFLLVALGSLVPSAASDYLSFTKTRFTLTKAVARRTLAAQVLLFLVDAAASIAIAIVFAVLSIFPGGALYYAVEAIADYLQLPDGHIYAYEHLHVHGLSFPVSVVLSSSAVMSLWIVVYVFSATLIVTLRTAETGRRLVAKYFPIKKHPLRSIGYVAILAFSIVYWVVVAVAWNS